MKKNSECIFLEICKNSRNSLKKLYFSMHWRFSDMMFITINEPNEFVTKIKEAIAIILKKNLLKALHSNSLQILLWQLIKTHAIRRNGKLLSASNIDLSKVSGDWRKLKTSLPSFPVFACILISGTQVSWYSIKHSKTLSI